ncbi:Lipopolysaccharide core heptosyltransferase III [hydrothermal vent metagenome]|uniref:Lipopolysaccharide core heptosyltransferase III n=1 Tax=hydrothermal vent metagenome TaxID=652676 RepID=A0A3B0Z0Z7_9ZZZZ
MLNDAVDFSQVKTVLVIKLRHFGDTLLTSPVFSVLKAHHPHIEIDALVYEETRTMLTLHPAISHIFGIQRSHSHANTLQQLKTEYNLFKQLKARRYDLIIHLTEHTRGLWLTRLLKPRYSVSYHFPGFSPRRKKFWKKTFTHITPHGSPQRHVVEKHLDTLRRMGLYPNRSERALSLVAGDAAEQRIDALLAQHGLEKQTYIHVHPTSRWLFKCWSPEKFSALINQLHKAGYTVVMSAAPDATEKAFVKAIQQQLKQPVIDVSGQLTLKEMAVLTQRAQCFIGMDSVPMHIAAAMNTPVVVLFGPSGDLEWGPWQVASKVITLAYACRPCGQDGCGGGKISECLTDISVNIVFDAVQSLLEKPRL